MWTIYQKQRKNTESHKKENSRYIYQNKIDKACFRHDIAYGRFKGLPEITASDKTLHNKGFNIPKNKRQDACFINFLIKSSSDTNNTFT